MFEDRDEKWLIKQYNRHRAVEDQINTIEELRLAIDSMYETPIKEVHLQNLEKFLEKKNG